MIQSMFRSPFRLGRRTVSLFHLLFILPLLLATRALHSEVIIPEGGLEIQCVPTPFASKASGKAEKTSTGWRVSVAKTNTTTSTYPEDQIGLRIEFPGERIKAQERLFCIVRARVAADYGEVAVRLSRADDSKIFMAKRFPIFFGTNWMDVPFVIVANESAEPPLITLAMGKMIQDIEIESVRVFRYPAGYDLARLSFQKVSYPGREPDSAWRAAAAERIEKIRKGDFILKVVDEHGKPISGARVHTDLYRHAFRFGSAVSVDLLAAKGQDADRYRALIDRLFSAAVFENDLKPQMFDKRKQKKQMEALETGLQWLQQNHIALRGHYLFQNAINSTMPESIKELGMEMFCTRLRESIRERVAFAGSRVCEWDAENHPLAWPSAKVLTDAPGYETLGEDLMREIGALTSLPLVVNEDNLCELKERQAYGTWDFLKHYREKGVRVDKLGHQAHFHLTNLLSPEEFMKVADHFAEVVPMQVVTEFDVLTNGDEQLASDFTRDLMIAAFSHPSFDGFISWGFWEGKAHRGDGMPWRKDWSPRHCGEMLEELLGKTWRTQTDGVSAGGGEITFRGFFGKYKVEGTLKGRVLRGEVELNRDSREVEVVLR